MLLRFPTPDDRAAFLAHLAELSPGLRENARASHAQPTVVVITPATQQESDILEALIERDGSIKSYSDVQFRALQAG